MQKVQVKVVDYRSVNLGWLIQFQSDVVSGKLAPEIELVVAREDFTSGDFKGRKGETFCLESRSRESCIVTRPYGDVTKGEVNVSYVSMKPRAEWSTEDVAEYVVKRACLKDQCTYLELLKPEKNVSSKEFKGAFVSQARRCRFVDLVDALEHCYELKKVDVANQFVWLDIFGANQPKLTAQSVDPAVQEENEQQLTKGLHVAIANFEDRVMFVDKWDAPTALTRAWCVWEIYGVDKAKQKIEIALPPSEYDRFILTLKTKFSSIIATTSAVDVEKAQCFNEADLRMIHGEILKNSSFSALNDIIKTQLRLWVASAGKLQVQKEEGKLVPDMKEISFVANQAGQTFQDQGDYANAELLIRKALAAGRSVYGNNHKVVATYLNNLGEVLRAQGKYNEAEPFYYEAIGIWKKTYGPEHSQVATGLNNLGLLLKAQGKYDEAKPLLEEALRIDKQVHGDEHPYVAMDLSNLAQLLNDQGKYDEAMELQRQALAIDRKIHGNDHPSVARDLNNVAGMLSAQGEYEQARPLYEESLRIRKKAHGSDHPAVAVQLNNLGSLLHSQGKFDEARPLYLESLRIRKEVFGNEHPSIATQLNNLAQLSNDQGRKTEAKRYGGEAHKMALKIYGEDHPTTQKYERWLTI